ncbi:MAG: hypothetical protein KDD69_02300, partial [Bdellovibrionales bacterium]|nr:hypothetical protein [Bdellovibrionales bacterium]
DDFEAAFALELLSHLSPDVALAKAQKRLAHYSSGFSCRIAGELIAKAQGSAEPTSLERAAMLLKFPAAASLGLSDLLALSAAWCGDTERAVRALMLSERGAVLGTATEQDLSEGQFEVFDLDTLLGHSTRDPALARSLYQLVRRNSDEYQPSA